MFFSYIFLDNLDLIEKSQSPHLKIELFLTIYFFFFTNFAFSDYGHVYLTYVFFYIFLELNQKSQTSHMKIKQLLTTF